MHKTHTFSPQKYFLPSYLPYFFFGLLQETNYFFLGLIKTFINEDVGMGRDTNIALIEYQPQTYDNINQTFMKSLKFTGNKNHYIDNIIFKALKRCVNMFEWKYSCKLNDLVFSIHQWYMYL